MSQKISKDTYKMYQLMEFFINKYSFNNVLVKEYIGTNEIWLANSKSTYTIIRISLNDLNEVYSSKNRIENYIETIKKSFKLKPSFLDIHICKDEVSINEEYDTVCIDENYISGVDLTSYYPLVDKVIHKVDNIEEEIANRIKLINNGVKKKIKNNSKLFKNKRSIGATHIISLISIIVTLISMYLSSRFDSSVSYILCGADYKFFTLGLKEFYRLFTYCFVHGGILHLFCNIYSFYILGTYFEYKLGTLKYVIVLFFGIIFGSLSNGILCLNGVEVGLSAGIYSLFSMYIIDAFKTGAYKNTSFILVLIINLSLNLQSGVAWQAHLGGAIAGLIFYFLYEQDKLDFKLIGLIVICLLALIYKYVTSDITPLYTGTDFGVVEALNKLNLNGLSNKLLEKIYAYLLTH